MGKKEHQDFSSHIQGIEDRERVRKKERARGREREREIRAILEFES